MALSGLNIVLNMFAGPIGGMVEKSILGGVAYGVGKGIIPPDSAVGLAAGLYAAFSALYTGYTRTSSAKIESINADDTNGVKVVRADAPVPAVNAPIPAPAGSRD